MHQPRTSTHACGLTSQLLGGTQRPADTGSRDCRRLRGERLCGARLRILHLTLSSVLPLVEAGEGRVLADTSESVSRPGAATVFVLFLRDLWSNGEASRSSIQIPQNRPGHDAPGTGSTHVCMHAQAVSCQHCTCSAPTCPGGPLSFLGTTEGPNLHLLFRRQLSGPCCPLLWLPCHLSFAYCVESCSKVCHVTAGTRQMTSGLKYACHV